MDLDDTYYRLVACGLAVMYIFQVFLTVGGGIKFIPLTGVTLPLVSYGGSSVLTSLIVFAIIQGLYMLRFTEEKEQEKARLKAEKTAVKRAKTDRRKAGVKSRNAEEKVIRSFLLQAREACCKRVKKAERNPLSIRCRRFPSRDRLWSHRRESWRLRR